MSWSKLCIPKSMGGIGFRELHSFNLAMLAKQGWRLMKNTHFLFYRVYKSKYFPNISFLDAPSPNLGSFAWKSIVAARSVLDKGLRWRVGTRNKIRIWQDRWLPTPPSFKVVTPCSTMSIMATVDNLIDPTTRSWRVSMIDHVFLPHEAGVIKSIPLSNRVVQDIQIWAYTNTGEYSVKSAYKMIQT